MASNGAFSENGDGIPLNRVNEVTQGIIATIRKVPNY